MLIYYFEKAPSISVKVLASTDSCLCDQQQLKYAMKSTAEKVSVRQHLVLNLASNANVTMVGRAPVLTRKKTLNFFPASFLTVSSLLGRKQIY